MPGLAPQVETAFAPFGKQRFAQCIVGALGVVGPIVEIKTEPRLDDGVDIEHAELAAEPHQID
jgi:hypothetical protein